MKKVLSCLSAFVAPLVSLSAESPPASHDSPRVFRDLSYVTAGHERNKLDLYLPAPSETSAPLILWVHGGGWQNGSKETGLPLRQGWTERGYAVASINYRLSGHAPFPAQIEDCKAAIRWLRAHAGKYGIDPERFGAWGSSAGGHLVALLGTSGGVEEFETGEHLEHSSRVQAVCDYYGPTDFTVFVTTPGYESHARPDSPEGKLLGGAVAENPAMAAKANPITHLDADVPPFLVIHGDRDPVVPINQSELLFEAIKDAGGSVHFHTIKGAAHGQGFHGPEIQTMVEAFFDLHLLAISEPAVIEAKRSESDAPEGGPRPQGRTGPPGSPRTGTMPDRGQMPSFDEILSRSDRDGDGKLSRDEFRGPPALFDRLDANGDGFVTRDEHEKGLPGRSRSGPRPPDPGTATTPSPAIEGAKPAPEGFTLEGERWTFRDGDFVVGGILLKPVGEGPFPAVLISHGLGGASQTFGLQKAREMVSWGLVCIAPDYTHSVGARGAPSPDFGASPENIRRALTCVDLLAKMPDVDPERIGAYGHSMGGFVTIGLAADAPGRLKAAAITASGISPREGFPSPAEERAQRVRTSFLVLHGTMDTTVRPEQSARFKEILDGNQVANERTLFDGEGHPIDQSRRSEVFASIREWFASQGVLP